MNTLCHVSDPTIIESYKHLEIKWNVVKTDGKYFLLEHCDSHVEIIINRNKVHLNKLNKTIYIPFTTQKLELKNVDNMTGNEQI